MVPADEDIKLMMAFKEGILTAFESLLEKHKKPVLNYVYRFINDKTEAEDITQEVFLRVYKARETYKPEAKFSTWLYRIATNLCIDYKRKLKSDALGYLKTDSDLKANTSPDLTDANVEQKQTEEIVRTSLSSLQETQQAALTLKVYENKSYGEIAQILSCSLKAVESLIFRARQNLKEKLKKSI